MPNFKSHFEFDNQQRGGILLLCSLIVGLCCVLYFYTPQPVLLLDICSPQIVKQQAYVDSLRLDALERKKPKRYPFNPNFISDYKAYTLGLTAAQFDRLSRYRSKNKWINSLKDFKVVTKASDSLMAIIGPLFKFPDWVVKSSSSPQKTSSLALSYKDKIDLNVATSAQLQQVRGIGPALSARIISYKDKLGGFSVDKQLLSVWGLSERVVANVLAAFTVKTPKQIHQISVNTASASDIATISGISYDLAKQIWEFRVLRQKIVSLSELQKIEGMTASKYALIELYLHVE